MATVFEFPYRTTAEVSLRALVKNLVVLRGLSKLEVIPVVKADAYGHGMIPVSKVLLSRGSCHTFAVATLEEAIELRKSIRQHVTVLVLSGFVPHQVDAYIRYGLTPVIHCLSHLKGLVDRKTLPQIHLKLDTGMNRLGLTVDEMPEVLQTLSALPDKIAGLMTHFAESEALTSSFIDTQINTFEELYRELQSRKLLQTDAKIHLSNSGGVLRRKISVANAVRPGIALYGILPNPRLANVADLVAALQWRTRVLSIRDLKKGATVGYGRTYRARRNEKIAVLPIGYADGYPRHLSNRGHVLIGGKKVPVRGRISMDLTTVDCTHVSGVREGTVATLIGNDISAWDLAIWAQTIPYEILCGISKRVPRIYLD